MNKKKLTYYVGNVFIFSSLFGFFFIFFPLFQVYLISPKITESLPANGIFITIPKIHAQAPVIENVDPWNENAYKRALKTGVAHAKGTSLPGKEGTTFLFAHSTGTPWEVTRFNTIFFRLGELHTGDTIIIVRDGKKYIYIVSDKKEVWPTEVNYLLQRQTNQLILQTCIPIGTSLKRLLIFAKPVSVIMKDTIY